MPARPEKLPYLPIANRRYGRVQLCATVAVSRCAPAALRPKSRREVRQELARRRVARRLSSLAVADKREFIYRVDSQDRIVFANQNWYDFARENGVPTLSPDVVIGRSLWNFIENAEIQHLFQILLEKIRQSGVGVTLPYRCDAPDCRRFMELQVIPQPERGIEFHSRILRQETRDPVRLMEENVQRTDERLLMCGWCKKTALPDGRWVEVEVAVSALQLFDAPRLPRISHGMCGECRAALEQSLRLFP